MNRTSPLLWSAAAVMLLVAAGCGGPSAAETPQGPAASEAESSAQPVRVSAASPERRTLRVTTVQPGRIESYEETPLHPKITGYVEAVLVDIGDHVEKGQVLVRLRVPEMAEELAQKEALVGQAEAEVAQAAAAVEAAAAAVTTATSRIAESRAGRTRAEGEHERWKAEHGRVTDLAQRGSVSNRLLDETRHQLSAATAALEEAEARIEVSQAALEESRANRVKSRADQAAAQARLRVAQADRSHMRALLEYVEIRAPFDGVVTERRVDTGHFVQPPGVGGSALLKVARMDKVRVFAEVPETEATLVDPGDAANVRVQAQRGREFEGAVTRTSWALERSNRTLRTEIEIDNDEGLLRPGMYASVTITLAERPETLVLPASAIVRDGRDTFCCCVVDGQVRVTPVVLGLRSGNDFEVLSGLSGTETIVQSRADTLAEGQAVEVLTVER